MKDTNKKKYKIYELGYGFSNDGLYCVKSDKKGFNEYRFYDGKWIEDWPEGIEFVFEGEPIEDFLVGDLHWRLISDEVKQLFEQEEIPGVQFLPVLVYHAQLSRYIGPYWVLNVIKSVEKLRWHYVSNLDFFRWTTGIFISIKLKKHLEIKGIAKGTTFIPVSSKFLGIED